jgi:outer membrane murein-binding lipoprotein Lpp
MRTVGIAFLSVLLLAGCGSGQNPVSQATAVKSAMAEVVSLERERARSVATVPATGFEVMSVRKTKQTASVSDSQGNVLTVTPAPSEAWVVEITAPPQGMWGSISALAEVDYMTGAVRGVGLWVAPANRPVKPLTA